MRQLCKNFLINWTICANRWANSRNAQRAACHMPPCTALPLLASQLPVTSCKRPVVVVIAWWRLESDVALAYQFTCHARQLHQAGEDKGSGGQVDRGELTRRQPTYLCRAESSCNYETETQTQPPGSSSSSTCCLDWWPRSLGCCWGCCCCCCCCWLWLYTSCGQTTQYINSPALAYFILRKKIMANIRELCDAAHQRESARHDR